MHSKNAFRFVVVCFLLAVFISLPGILSAQNKNAVSGSVISEANEPINGVTILWSNKGVGSITNSEGKFVILLQPPYNQKDSLSFSCIGYKTQKLAINALINNDGLVIKLGSLVENLKEIVIKPLSLKQLLDSIEKHNDKMFVSPGKLNGYYREFVFSNAKCTEYSDALFDYYFDNTSKTDGQLKINASRCLKIKKVNNDVNNVEVYGDSKINPNVAFKYALLSEMIEKFFPEKSQAEYDYNFDAVEGSEDVKITVYPKPNSTTVFYKLTLNLKNDFTIKSYHLEIPDDFLKDMKERSLLGIHSKPGQFVIDVNYAAVDKGIYPDYYSTIREQKIWGKMLGASVNETIINKSEFVVSEVNDSKELKAFPKNEVYKKGNICDNGLAINDVMLKNYTIIKPSAKDSIAIQSITN